jgi:NADH-quinone oxidoreductase subunit C
MPSPGRVAQPGTRDSPLTEPRPLVEVLSGRADCLDVEPGPPVVLTVGHAGLPELASILQGDPELGFSVLYSVSGVDLSPREKDGAELFQTVYHLWSPSRGELAVIKVEVPSDTMTVPSVSGIWAGADWHERECYDMFGILFSGHPGLRHLLVPDHEIGFLLRKSVPIRTKEQVRTRVD